MDSVTFLLIDGSFLSIAEQYPTACVWKEKQLFLYSSRFLLWSVSFFFLFFFSLSSFVGKQTQGTRGEKQPDASQ